MNFKQIGIFAVIFVLLLPTIFQAPCVAAGSPSPDLVVTDIWRESNLVNYQVRNMGNETAPEGHYAALFINEIYVVSDLAYDALEPGERWNGAFDWELECLRSDYNVMVWADYESHVPEEDEANNVREEIWKCEVTAPQIISGPMVEEITQSSAVIVWDTDEVSDSVVKYGRRAGVFELEEAEVALTRSHSITLMNLEPSSTYHFVVRSTDPGGNAVESRDKAFETLPLVDGEDPIVSIIDPGVCEGIVAISAEAFDNIGIERVEFYVNGERKFTDYSASSTKYMFKWDTKTYANGAYILGAKVYDSSGGFFVYELPVVVENEVDPTVPKVTIGYPLKDEKVSDEIGIVVFVSDDKGISKIECLIDGKSFKEFKYPSPPPPPADVYFMGPSRIMWDTSGWPDGKHRIGVNATDVDGKSGLGYVDVVVSNGLLTPQPGLVVKNHKVTRHGSAFAVELTVQSMAKAGVKNIKIEEFLKGFQPISRITSSVNYEAYFNVQKKVWTCNITKNGILPYGSSETFIYSAVPVLVHPDSLKPSIGNPIKLSYHNIYTGFDEKHETQVSQVVYHGVTNGGKPTTKAYEDALKEANYLIVTNPESLRWMGFGTIQNHLDQVLSDMAELAFWHHSAVLGYLYPPSLLATEQEERELLRKLIKATPVGAWADKLDPDFRKPLSGYLLIVGKSSIVPSWKLKSGDSKEPYIEYSDYPYSTRGGSVPDLIVGRILGDTPQDLSKAIQTSIGVLKWRSGMGSGAYRFDWSDALLLSGAGSSEDVFKNTVDGVASYLKSNGFKNVVKIHWSKLPFGTDLANTFKTNALNKNLIWFFGHGSANHWGPAPDSTGIKSVNFNGTNPVVLAASCNSGDYVSGTIAQGFFDRGAAVYIGSTGGSYPDQNKILFPTFFKSWTPSKSVGEAFTEAKKKHAGLTSYWMWIIEYNLYGDPKFGITQSPSGAGSALEAQLFSSPPTTLEFEVPDYVVETDFFGEGLDYVRIPEGLIWFEEGQLHVPFYSMSIDYPPGYEINDVMLSERYGLVRDTGLNIPMTSLEMTPCVSNCVPYSGTLKGWFPQQEYTWDTVENSDGTKTLMITMYPFYYNPLTTDIRFYKNYRFDVDYTISRVSIASLSTGKPAYQQGESIMFNVEFDNPDEAQDVIVYAVIRRYGEDETVAGLQLRTLKKSAGLSSFSPKWDSNGFETGYYLLEVTLTDTLGNMLDRKTEIFRLGTSSGQIASLTATPEYFHQGDDVEISVVFNNSGTIPITGVAHFNVFDSDGITVDEFQHEITDLSPSESIGLSATWGTSGVEEGSYRIVGWVLYDGKATEPLIVTVQTDYTPKPSPTPAQTIPEYVLYLTVAAIATIIIALIAIKKRKTEKN